MAEEQAEFTDTSFDVDGSSTPMSTSKAGPGRKAQLLSLLALIVIGLFTVFAIQNADSVELEVFAWTFSTSRIVVMLGSAFVGAVAATVFGRLRRRS